MARHIMRRGGVFYFRRLRKIPVGTADRPFRTVISLRTHIATIAHYRCAVANAVYERMTMLVANDPVGDVLDDADVTAAVDAAVRFALADAERARLRSGELTDFEVKRAPEPGFEGACSLTTKRPIEPHNGAVRHSTCLNPFLATAVARRAASTALQAGRT